MATRCPGFRFSGDKKLAILAKQGELLSYKVTRGSWAKVECDKNGNDIENRTAQAWHDTSIVLNVDFWKDDFGPPPAKKHTASENVSVLDSAFYIRELNRKRAVRIYLPPDYATSGKKYPVLYMQDGQNCFDEFTSGFGEWQADETLDHFYDSCKKSMIVVAIDHGDEHRLQEYNPYDHVKFGKGEGAAYLHFLVYRLKPFIDSSFRTLSSRKHSSIAGSSMGGLISMYAMLEYPDVFGKAGVFSPSFWIAPDLYVEAKNRLKVLKGAAIFFYAGAKESDSMVTDMRKMEDILKQNKKIRTIEFVDGTAKHNEAAWRKWFPYFVNWLLK